MSDLERIINLNIDLATIKEQGEYTKFILEEMRRQATQDKQDITDRLDKVEERLGKKIESHDVRLSVIEDRWRSFKSIGVFGLFGISLGWGLIKFGNDFFKFITQLGIV